MLKRPSRSPVSSPTVRVGPACRLRATGLGRKDNCSAASMTRCRVSSRTWLRPLSALEAVAGETPASRATSLRVAGRPAVCSAGWTMAASLLVLVEVPLSGAPRVGKGYSKVFFRDVCRVVDAQGCRFYFNGKRFR